MSNLPIQFIDKENSPALLAIMQQFGEHTYVDAELINKFRDALNELYFSSNPDRIISLGTETIDGNEHTYEDYTWQLGGVQVNNIGNPSVIVIPSATIGFKRKDISVFTAAGTIERVAGTETDGEVVTSPDVPEGTLYYKSYDIDGDTIDVDPEPPAIDGAIFKQKNESQKFTQPLGGTNAVINLQTYGQQYYVVVGPVTSIAGFSKALLTATPIAEVPYGGKDFYFENKTDHDVTLKNNFSGVDIKLNLGADLVVPVNGIVWFKYDASTETLNLFFKNWTQIIIWGYFNGTNFYTDAGFTNLITPESGKIYLAIDTNKTYRWSGSAYVQIGGDSEVEQQLQRYWYSMTANTLNTTLMLVNNTNSFTVSGTASIVSRAGTLYYNSIAMNNYLSATANGSNCGIKNNNQGDGSYLEGFDSTFVFINNDTNVNCETTVGYYGLLSAIPNIAKSAYTTDLTCVGNDVGDTNLSFYCKRNTETPSYTKVDCGSAFPAHSTNDAYIFRMQMSRGYKGTERTLKMSIKNIITGAEFTHTFTDTQIPSHSRNIAMVVNRSNRNTGVATNIRFSKWHQTKYIY